MIRELKIFRKIALVCLSFIPIVLFSQCDLELKEQIEKKIKEDNVEFLKDFSVKLGSGESSERFSMVLKENNLYRFYIFESDKYDGKGHFELQKESQIIGSNLNPNSGKTYNYFDFRCTKTGVHDFTIFKDDGKKYCAELVLTFVEKFGNESGDTSGCSKSDIFTVVEVMPEFKEGKNSIEAFRKWMAEHLEYPEKAKKEKIEGRVFIQFVVSDEGKVKDVKVVRGVNPILDNYAVNLIKSSPKWEKPGYNEGVTVNTQFTFPVNFELSK